MSSSTVTSTFKTSFEANARLSALKQYAASALVGSAYGWGREGAANILRERVPGDEDPNAPASPYAYLIIVGRVAVQRLYVGPVGSFNPTFSDKLERAKYTFMLKCPNDDPVFKTKWKDAMKNLKAFEHGVCGGNSVNFFTTVDGEEALRFTGPVFRAKGEHLGKLTGDVDATRWPVGKPNMDALKDIAGEYSACPFPLYDENERLVPTAHVQRVFGDCLAEVHFRMVYYNFTRGNRTVESMTGDLGQAKILNRARAKPVTPFAKQRGFYRPEPTPGVVVGTTGATIPTNSTPQGSMSVPTNLGGTTGATMHVGVSITAEGPPTAKDGVASTVLPNLAAFGLPLEPVVAAVHEATTTMVQEGGIPFGAPGFSWGPQKAKEQGTAAQVPGAAAVQGPAPPMATTVQFGSPGFTLSPGAALGSAQGQPHVAAASSTPAAPEPMLQPVFNLLAPFKNPGSAEPPARLPAAQTGAAMPATHPRFNLLPAFSMPGVSPVSAAARGAATQSVIPRANYATPTSGSIDSALLSGHPNGGSMVHNSSNILGAQASSVPVHSTPSLPQSNTYQEEGQMDAGTERAVEAAAPPLFFPDTPASSPTARFYNLEEPAMVSAGPVFRGDPEAMWGPTIFGGDVAQLTPSYMALSSPSTSTLHSNDGPDRKRRGGVSDGEEDEVRYYRKRVYKRNPYVDDEADDDEGSQAGEEDRREALYRSGEEEDEYISDGGFVVLDK
ncbi:hypothetical protein B0H16DRAFT_1450943 [Mycena metata]|uniref:Uncharacterized protein n=1 Tax=Mycena metata TaxID=1033252 RepID=A0AAD7NRZ2_9AGAR|nr:hypothetical protein B0H16DRAFT_1450943 [Mycena metata]